MMINEPLKTKLPEVERLFKTNKVERAYVFGSVCTDSFKPDSDIDFIIAFKKEMDPVEYGEKYFILLDGLREILNRDVDLIAEETINNPYFIKVINKTKIPIYE